LQQAHQCRRFYGIPCPTWMKRWERSRDAGVGAGASTAASFIPISPPPPHLGSDLERGGFHFCFSERFGDKGFRLAGKKRQTGGQSTPALFQKNGRTGRRVFFNPVRTKTADRIRHRAHRTRQQDSRVAKTKKTAAPSAGSQTTRVRLGALRGRRQQSSAPTSARPYKKTPQKVSVVVVFALLVVSVIHRWCSAAPHAPHRDSEFTSKSVSAFSTIDVAAFSAPNSRVAPLAASPESPSPP